jgi:hypothetical protein
VPAKKTKKGSGEKEDEGGHDSFSAQSLHTSCEHETSSEKNGEDEGSDDALGTPRGEEESTESKFVFFQRGT